MKIGLIADFVGNTFENSIIKAKEIGATGVQKYMTTGIFNAWDLDAAKVKEVNDIMDSNGMIFSAICGDFGLDLDDDTIVEKSKRVLEKAK